MSTKTGNLWVSIHAKAWQVRVSKVLRVNRGIAKTRGLRSHYGCDCWQSGADYNFMRRNQDRIRAPQGNN